MMKIENEVFNGIFYNLDAQTHWDYIYNSID